MVFFDTPADIPWSLRAGCVCRVAVAQFLQGPIHGVTWKKLAVDLTMYFKRRNVFLLCLARGSIGIYIIYNTIMIYDIMYDMYIMFLNKASAQSQPL